MGVASFAGRIGNLLAPFTSLMVSIAHFYRAMLCLRGTSHGPVSVSVCLSVCVTSRCSTKTAEHSRPITQTKPHDSSRTLVFRC